MKIKAPLTFFIVSILSVFMIASTTSCKKELNFSKGNLTFSTDTLVFDTVFTTIGSTTKRFRFRNPSKQTIKIDEVELMGGPDSPFRMNVDGFKGTLITDLEIEGEDSLFVFVEATLDVNGNVLPMIVEDSIRFRTNGKDQYVNLAIWGQDAYFHYKDINEGVWPNDKPHVIYNFAAIDSATTLTIQEGTQVHLHKNSILYNYKGTLNIEGTADNKVVFQGDRLETFYDNITGQYYGIYMQEARPSVIRHTVVKNGIAGIHVFSRDEDFNDYTLTIENSEIFNNSNYGIFLYSGARIKAENSIIHSNGLHALLVLEGGSFNFNYCNLLSYGSNGQSPAVGISNYFVDNANGVTNVGSIPEGTITNSVIYGFQDNEIAIDTLQLDGQVQLNFNFDNNLVRLEEPSTDPIYQNTIWNEEPLFTNVIEADFSFPQNSPLNGQANHNFFLPMDFFETARDVSTSDIGAVEQP